MAWNNVYSESAARRLFAKLKQVGECFEWQGYTNPKGYGHISIHGKNHYTHRVMMEIILKRYLKTEEIVCHSVECSNPKCCRPEHLRVGDLMDNVADRVEAGKPRRKIHSGRRLTVEQVMNIRLRLTMGQSVYRIAADLLKGETTIRDIRDWRTWRDVTLPPKPT